MSLSAYNQKRRFDSTPEPAGKSKQAASKQLEFVIQKHHASRLHYDFRLEMAGVLKSWAVPKGPSLNPVDKRLAMMVEDHPYEYRKFEGVIPRGNYGAGNVIIWDKGTYEPRIKATDPQKQLLKELAQGHLTFIMHGQKLNGEFALVKRASMEDNAWLLIKKKDEYARQEDVSAQNRSVISGLDVEEIDKPPLDLDSAPKAAMPRQLKPMLATLTDQAFDDENWLFEIKWDGYRAIGGWDARNAELYSRNGQDFSRYAPVIESLRNLGHKVVLDGEVVTLDEDGRSNFGWLQNYLSRPQGQLIYYAFDIIWCDGRDLTGLPLESRKKILKEVIVEDGVIRYSDDIRGRGRDFFDLAVKRGLEGIIAKKTDSLYRPAIRSQQWLKIKTHLRQEAVIAGFTEPRGSRSYIGALILGVYEGNELVYVGHTGGGIPTEQLPVLRKQLERLERKTSPFKQSVRPNATVHWVQPKLLVEVSFSEWTAGGNMRQPIFIGMREDKQPEQVRREKPHSLSTEGPAEEQGSVDKSTSTRRVEFSHLDKVFFPKSRLTKGDLIDYYRHMAPRMLKYIEDRPHSLLRQPNGINGKSFFQKDVGDLVPDWIKTQAIYSESNQKDINYLVCDSTDSLMYMVQLGCIEINPWSSRLKNLKNPDWVVLDLDPEAIGFKQVVKVAQMAQKVLGELKIPSYPKTSGKTGIHIYIPLQAKYSYDQTKQLGELLAHLVNQRLPKITSIERSPAKRQGKVYLDFLQNRQGQTLAAPYSVRPTEGASVSTPLHWDEVNSKLDPSDYTIKTIFKRLDRVGELWCPVIGKGIDLAKTLKALA